MNTHWTTIYRPRSVATIHLDSVRATMTALLSAERFPHVFLFTGPKGTGKTTVARIIGAILNDPKNATAVQSRLFGKGGRGTAPPLQEVAVYTASLDAIFNGESYNVRELDAASNRGIDDVRQLKEQVQLPPVGGGVTVYILDEVHMLTTEAFNALLKMLEEPPEHVVFILATTELQKIPDTVISRCQVLQFHKASDAELITAMNAIAQKEKLSIPESEIAQIATLADGSFRDAVKFLELRATLTAGTLEAALHVPSVELAWNILDAVVEKDEGTLLEQFQTIRMLGIQDAVLLRTVVGLIHQDLITQYVQPTKRGHFSTAVDLFLLQTIASPDLLKPSPLPHLRLELAFLELIQRAKSKQSSSTPSDTSEKPQESPPKPTAQKNQNALNNSTRHTATVSQLKSTSGPEVIHSASSYLDQELQMQQRLTDTITVAIPTTSDTESTITPLSPHPDQPLGDGAELIEKWPELISLAAKQNFSLAALLRSATPIAGEQGKMTVRVFYTFHKDQLLQPKWLTLLQDLITQLAGGYVQISCEIATPKVAELVENTNQADLQRLAVEALL